MRILTTSVLAIAAALALAARTTTGEIDGQRIRGTAEPVPQAKVATNLYADAPQWFRDGWRRYLNDADGRYAVLAVDRNRAAGDTSTAAAQAAIGLRVPDTGRGRTFGTRTERLNPAARTSENTPRRTAPTAPSTRSKDKIVWKDPMPWE